MQPLTELLEHYLSVSPQIAKHTTREHYWRSVRQFAAHLDREPTVADLNDDAIHGFMIAAVRDGLAEATANQRMKQLRALWEWAARRRLVDQFPTLKKMVEPEPLPVAWRPDELQRLFAACAAQTGWIGPHQAATWWLALHWWLYDTGERAAATFSLRREWVDLASGTVRVPAKTRKGGRKAMVYRLRPETVALFTQMMALPSDSGLIWDRPWKEWQCFYKRYRRVVQAAGLPWAKRKTGLHKMRVTVFTMIEAHGGNATTFARHSHRSVTESYIDKAIIAACGAGQWPLEAVRPDSPPPGFWKRLWGRAG